LPGSSYSHLERLRREANEVLLSSHGGALYLALGGVPWSPPILGGPRCRRWTASTRPSAVCAPPKMNWVVVLRT
jgi:hypothetical protein